MAASFLSGDVVKMLKDQIELVSGYKIIFGTVTPDAVAVEADKGSVYISETTGLMYIKQDDGSTLNWEPLATDNQVSIAVTALANGIEISKGTRLVSSALATITGAGATVTVPSYKVHIVDHATNSLTVAESTTPVVLTPPNYTAPIWYAYITAANTVQWEAQEIGVPANRTLVPIFSAITNGTAIVALNNGTRGSYRDFNGFIQDFALAYDPKSVEGNVITLTDPQATGALVNKTVGKIFVPGANVPGNTSGSEGVIVSSQFAPYASITNDMSGAGGVGFINFQSARLSGTNYDLNGVLTAVGATRYSIRPIYIGQGGLIVSPLGQQFYTSATNAKNALGTEVLRSNPNLKGLLLLGWAICRGNNAEFQFIANANVAGGGAPNVSLNLWSTRTLTSADSPFTVTGSKTIYVCDTSAGNIEIVLPTIDSSIASDENRFVKSADANSVKVYVNGVTQTIGSKVEQFIWEENAAFSVVASDTLEYLITQDSRKVDTFETPVGVWAKTSSIEHWDLDNSIKGTGALFGGNNHGFTLTTGTTASTVYSKEVSTEELTADKNYFAFVANRSTAGVFDLIVEGWNGSAWAPAGGLVAPFAVGTALNGLVPFNKTGYTKWRAVLTNTGTTAGLTCTIARGEWTDSYWKEVQITSDPVIVERAGNAGEAITANVTDIPFGIGAGKITSFTMPFDGEISISSCWYADGAASATDLYIDGTQAKRIGAVDGSVSLGEFSATAKKGQVFSVRATGSHALLNNSKYHYITFTATPIGTSKGIVAAAEIDLSQYQYPQYDISSYVSGISSIVKATATPYKKPDGSIHAKIEISTNASALTIATVSISGILFDGTALNYQGAVSSNSSGAVAYRAMAYPSTSNVVVTYASAVTGAGFRGDFQLGSWPSWATQPTIKPATIIAPVAVANYVSAELTGYAAGASGTAGTIQFANAVNSLPDYLEISANKDRVTFKKAVKNVSTQGSYACTTSTAPSPVIRLYNSSGVVRIEDYDAQTANQSESKGVTLLFDANEGDYILLYKGSSAGTPINSAATRLFVKCLDIETGHIASSKEEIHKHATYLSSNETEAGWCEFTGKKIYKRWIYFPVDVSANNASHLFVGTNLLPVDAPLYSSSLWNIRLESIGGNYAQLAYTKSTGYIGVFFVGGYKFGAGTRIPFLYTKD